MKNSTAWPYRPHFVSIYLAIFILTGIASTPLLHAHDLTGQEANFLSERVSFLSPHMARNYVAMYDQWFNECYAHISIDSNRNMF